MNLSVIIPVFNSAAELRECLVALNDGTRPPDEIIVADDGSTDQSAAIAREHGARVVEVDHGPRGPAVARNLAANVATGDILVFVDADVKVHPQTLHLLADEVVAAPDVAAFFGSYDDAPVASNLVARYVNLRHHFVHQSASRDAWTFWSGLGAVRRAPCAVRRFFRPVVLMNLFLALKISRWAKPCVRADMRFACAPMCKPRTSKHGL